MRAAVFDTFGGALEVRQVPDPLCPPDGAVIEVRANGVCRSDWHAWLGHDPTIKLPHVPGHELAGVVAEVGGNVTAWQPGDRVTTPFCGGCGACRECLSGNGHICDNDYQPGFSGWGSFAEYVLIPNAENLVRLPEGLEFTEAASLGCRFMTAFRAVVDQGQVRPGEWLAVHGCGGVGLSAIMIGVALGSSVVAVDIDADKLRLARTLGASLTFNAAERNPVRAIKEATAGGAHVSLDALGSRATCQNSVRNLRKRGRHVQVGLLLAEDARPPIPMFEVIAKELHILGSHGMQAHRYPAMLRMITEMKLEPHKLIGKTISLADAGAELAAMGSFKQQGVTVIDTF